MSRNYSTDLKGRTDPQYVHIKLSVFINADTCKLGVHPFPQPNKVMALVAGEERTKGRM
jgi:hypothetical protein